MFGDLKDNQREAALEALLFVSDEPVSTITLADMLEADPADVQTSLMLLRTKLNEREAGIRLLEVAGGWRLATATEYHDLLEKYVLSWDTRRLTQAALETLAIVAYLQPITRGGVAGVRGVNSDSPINSLIDKGLLREAGTSDAPGNPTLYATTRTFLEKFGLRTVADLPKLEDFAPDEETAELLRQGLSARTPYEQGEFELTAEDAPSVQPAQEGEGEEGAACVSAVTGAAEAMQDAARLALAAQATEDFDEALKGAMDAMIGDVLGQAAGVVEKIDFDQLDFEE